MDSCPLGPSFEKHKDKQKENNKKMEKNKKKENEREKERERKRERAVHKDGRSRQRRRGGSSRSNAVVGRENRRVDFINYASSIWRFSRVFNLKPICGQVCEEGTKTDDMIRL